MALFDTFSSKSNVATTSTVVAVDSYNRAFNSSRNTANSNNLSIAVGSDADPFAGPGETLQKSALLVVGALVLAGLAAWVFVRKRPG